MKNNMQQTIFSQFLTAGVAMVVVMVIFYAGVIVGKASVIFELYMARQ